MEPQGKHSHDDRQKNPSFFRGPVSVAISMVIVIGVFYLLREHWYHIVGYWPYLLLLLCPLMHLLMGHGGHGKKTQGGQ